MDPRIAGASLLRQRLSALQPAEAVGPAATLPLPDYVAHALARFRLLHDVPFRYLVPDARLLPLESVRFFILDEDWLDALASGALVAGGGGSREQSRARAASPQARQVALAQRALVRGVTRGRVALTTATSASGGARPVSGFLLRSALVSGWEGMSVRAWTSDDPANVPPAADAGVLERTHPELVVPLLRLERLSPSVLLALFDGVPRLVWLEEPHHGVQYGMEAQGGGYQVAIRDQQGQPTSATVAVPMRAGGPPGIVDVSALAAAIDGARPVGSARGSGALALQLLQAPSRQRFAAGGSAPLTRPGRRR